MVKEAEALTTHLRECKHLNNRVEVDGVGILPTLSSPNMVVVVVDTIMAVLDPIHVEECHPSRQVIRSTRVVVGPSHDEECHPSRLPLINITRVVALLLSLVEAW